MAIVVGDILEITDIQSFLAQQMLNVYTYEVMETSVDVGYDDVANRFNFVVTDVVRQIQSTGCDHTSVRIRNLTNGIDIYEAPVLESGVGAGETLASFYALSYRLVRTNATTRHGAKRIGGVTETTVLGNGVVAGSLAAVNAIADAMQSTIGVDAGGSEDFLCRPVIVGRFPLGHAQEGEYNISVINPVASAQFIRVSTQTTRRAGRGS